MHNIENIISNMNNEEITFDDFKEAIYRKGKFGFLAFLIILLVSLSYVIFKTPIYESEIRVRLPGATSVTEMVLAGATTPWNDVPTQLELIKSKGILKKVSDKLNLRVVPLDKRFNELILVKSIQISDSFPPGLYGVSLNKNSYAIYNIKTNDTIASGVPYGVVFNNEHLKIELELKNSKAIGKTLKFEVKSINSVIRSLSRNVKVSREGQSFVAVIKARSKDPLLAKRIAEEVANGYYEFTLEDVRFQATALRHFLEEQIGKIEEQLSNYETELARVKNTLGTYNFFALENISESIKDIFSKMNELEFQRITTHVQKQELQKEIESYKAQLEGRGYFSEYAKIASSLEAGGDPKVLNLQNRLYELELKKASLLQKYNEENPEIKAIDSQISEIKSTIKKYSQENAQILLATSDPVFQQLAQKIVLNQAEILTLDAREKAIDSALTIYEGKVSNLPEKALMYSKIKRKIFALSSIYNLLLEKLEQTKVEEASKISDVRIIDFAMIPTSPVSPKRVQTIVISIILGVILGLFTSLTIYYLDDTVKFASEVENLIGKPCIGRIPVFNKDNNSNILIDSDLLSPEAEAFKKLRFNIEILAPQKPKIIAVTSVTENEGKSTVAANLAIAYALTGVRTLLIDCDLRKPAQHTFFNLPNETGFSELLTKGILKPVAASVKNLFVLPTGSNAINILKILDAFDLRKTYEILTENFEVIILDTPPLLPVAETITLASFARNLILVVRNEYTKKKLILEAAPNVPEKINLLGFVINFYRREGGYYRYYYKNYSKTDKLSGINGVIKKIISR